MICCNSAFEQGNLDLWRYINAFIIIIITGCVLPGLGLNICIWIKVKKFSSKYIKFLHDKYIHYAC